MAKVIIIDVNLDINIDELIENNAKELTSESRKELDSALAVAVSAKKLKDAKDKEKTEQVTGVVAVMEEAFQRLFQAKSNGVPVDEILELVKQYVPTSPAFTLRMKNILSAKGNPYRIIRDKINGRPHYLFTSFNEQI